MLTREQQETLTRVGPGTPMGALLRRYWLPVAATSELRPGTVLPVRVLGEDLAVFRTTGGTLGLLDARCPHRGASLVHGIVDDCTIRCAYHGWRFDAAGACVEMPALAGDGARLRERARTRAYRVDELGGLVSNARGRGLMIAFDLPDHELRGKAHAKIVEAGCLLLTCGPRSIRFRPPLNLSAAEADAGLEMARKALKAL